jgi:predicted phage-related endonuclease
MIELNVVQGSPEWSAARAKCFTASEAPAMVGVSKYMTRSELLRQKATGVIPEVDAATQARFDMGHAVEALARPLAEKIIGTELYPVVATDDTGRYLASSDGVASNDGAITFLPIGFEHKAFNDALADQVRQGVVPASHSPQLDHQALVFGFEKILFMVSDGTPDRMAYCWYFPTQENIDALIAGWAQFQKDLENYQPSETKDLPKAEVTVDLPTLFVHAKGEITTHNMDEFDKALTVKLAETRAVVLVTDQDFSNAKEVAKKFRETAKAIALSKEQMLAQTETIGEAARKMDAWVVNLNKTALQLEKDVEREDRDKKEKMILVGKADYADHVAALESEISPIRLGLAVPNFADAIKGKRNYVSMQDAINTMLASAKVSADAAAKDVRAKLAWCKEHAAGQSALFPDLQQIITKPMVDFTLTITSRMDKAKFDEIARLEAERQRIRAEEETRARRVAQEEQARLQREAAEKAAAEHREVEAAKQARRQEWERLEKELAAKAFAVPTQQAQVVHIQPVEIPQVEQNQQVANVSLISEGETIRLGEICAELEFTVTADFLEKLGYRPVRTEKAAKLYSRAQLPGLYSALIQHISNIATGRKRAAA